MAFSQIWSAVGSAGFVDERDLDLYQAVGGRMKIRLDAPAQANLNVRYSVIAVRDLFGGPGYRLSVRYQDNGADARVKVKLNRYSWRTGDTATLMTWDSDDRPPTDGFETDWIEDCALDELDFSEFVYFFEAVLRRASRGGRPALGSLALEQVTCGGH